MRKNRSVSIGATMMMSVITLAALVFVAGTFVFVGSYKAASDARHIRTVGGISDLLLDATEALALERGTTNTALAAPDPAASAIIERISSLRVRSNTALDAALGLLPDAMIPGQEDLLADIRSNRTRIDQLRAEADRALPQAGDRRPEALLRDWMPSIVALMDSVAVLSTNVGHDIKLGDPLVAEQTFIKEWTWSVRNTAGRQRAAIGAILAEERAPTPAELETIAAFGVAVDTLWGEIHTSAARPGAPAILANQTAETHARYFGDFRPALDRVVADLNNGVIPMSGPEWYDLSNPALAVLMDVKAAATAVTQSHTDDMVSAARLQMVVSGLLLALSLVVAILALLATRYRLVKPLRCLTGTIETLASGNYSIDVPRHDRRDEVGAMSEAVATLRDAARQAQALREEKEAAQIAEIERSKALALSSSAFSQRIQAIVQNVSEAAASLNSEAHDMADLAGDSNRRSQDVATASAEASANVQTVATAAEELFSSVSEINRQIDDSRRLSDSAVAEMNATGDAVRALSEATTRIGDVVTLIEDIANQTNLLALNATIEAARAGDAGQGFAVVAKEVKTLAHQTAQATGNIGRQINEMQSVTAGVVKRIGGVAETVGRLNDYIGSVAAAAEEQGAATQEISRNVQQAAVGTQLVSENITVVGSAAERTGRMAGGLLDASEMMKTQATDLKSEVEGFLQRTAS